MEPELKRGRYRHVILAVIFDRRKKGIYKIRFFPPFIDRHCGVVMAGKVGREARVKLAISASDRLKF
jgi:hypothetical protein